MRRALLLRDRGCRFPGCNATRYVDGHHIDHWADGGETNLTNLVTLCHHHHRLIHECDFTVTRSGPNRFEFKSPSGNVIPDAAPPPTTTRRPDLRVHIDKDTSACQWDGLPNDYSGSVAVLQMRDGRDLFWPSTENGILPGQLSCFRWLWPVPNL